MLGVRQREREAIAMAVLTRAKLAADLSGLTTGGVAYVHDYALDGDENLHIGARVDLVDGTGRHQNATVVQRDEQRGYWFLELE
jgi:hypothetical protein